MRAHHAFRELSLLLSGEELSARSGSTTRAPAIRRVSQRHLARALETRSRRGGRRVDRYRGARLGVGGSDSDSVLRSHCRRPVGRMSRHHVVGIRGKDDADWTKLLWKWRSIVDRRWRSAACRSSTSFREDLTTMDAARDAGARGIPCLVAVSRIDQDYQDTGSARSGWRTSRLHVRASDGDRVAGQLGSALIPQALIKRS